MASGNPPSKKKSSSSHKHKLSKKSSEVKKRKRGRSRKRDKSKKLHRRDVSVSSSEDDSRKQDSLSISSSDSEDDYRCRKARSRTREDVKGSKKRVKRSDSPIRRRKRRSKHSDGSKVKKKSRQGRRSRKEGSRRDPSVDSRNGGSRSSGEENEFGRRGKTKGKEEEGKTTLDKTSIGDDRYKFRSRSCSPCSGGSERSYYISEVKEGYSSRLRSVLSIPDEREGGGIYQSKDENKAEIIQAYDDCPSCKSNDSYDGGRKKESSYQEHIVSETNRYVNDGMVEDEWRKESTRKLNVVPEKKTQIHNEKVEDGFTSKIKMTSFASEDQCGRMDHTTSVESMKVENRSEVSSNIVTSNVSDLESILRQKALENLRKFRQVNTGVKQSSTPIDEPFKTESSKEVDTRAKDTEASEMKNVSSTILERISVPNTPRHGVHKRVDDTKAEEKKIINSGTIPKPNRCSLVYRRESSGDHPLIKHASESGNVSTRIVGGVSVTSSPKKLDTMRADDRGPTETKTINLGAPRKPNRGSLVYRREPSIKQASPSQETISIANKTLPELPKAELSIAPSTTAGENGSTEPGNAARGSSEFEQKTMSVMRGGEMVQVSYKVYIPKKPPALARRQLKR